MESSESPQTYSSSYEYKYQQHDPQAADMTSAQPLSAAQSGAYQGLPQSPPYNTNLPPRPVAPTNAAPPPRPYAPPARPPSQAGNTPTPSPQTPQNAQQPPPLRRIDSRNSFSAPPQPQQQPQPGGQPVTMNRPPNPGQQGPLPPRPPQQMMTPQPRPLSAQQPPGMRPPIPNSNNPQQRPMFPPNQQPPGQQPPQRPLLRPQQSVPGQMSQPIRPPFPPQQQPQRPMGPTNQMPLQRPPQPQQQQAQKPLSQTVQQQYLSQRNSGPDPDNKTYQPKPGSENMSKQLLSSIHDDDEDVVMGRATTPNYPQAAGNQPQQNYQQRPSSNTSPNSTNLVLNRDNSGRNLSSPSGQPQNQQFDLQAMNLPYQMQRSDSKQSIPSRPQSRTQSRPPSGPDNPPPVRSSPESSSIALKPSVSFVDPEASKQNANSAINLRTIPEGNRSVNAPLNLQNIRPEFKVGSLTNSSNNFPKPITSPQNLQQSVNALNLNSILNSDRPKSLVSDYDRGRNYTSGDSAIGSASSGRVSYQYSKGDNDSGVDESTQGNERNGPASPSSPLKSPSKIPGYSRPSSTTPINKSRSTSRTRLTAKTPENPVEPIIKKVPMNKIQVGGAPSPNLKQIKSKIGSLENATHKPGGGHVKIESKKIEIKAAPRIAAKNETYVPGGGDKKIVQTKLQWNARPKIGSLDNAGHKPGGGDKKIESIKLDFKDNVKSKVGSKDYIKHVPGGGEVKVSMEDLPYNSQEKERPVIQTHKVEVKAQSKIGSLDNVKYKPGGGDKKIFDDKEYLRNVEHPIAPSQPSQNPDEDAASTGTDENSNQRS